MAEGWANYLTRGVPPVRRALIGGNWKCNGTSASNKKMIDLLNNAGVFPLESEVVIAVPSLYLLQVKSVMRSDVELSSQDVLIKSGFGAYTGEISAAMLADSGIKWTLTGHSERRVGFGYP
eukprot:gene5274-6974_t